MKLYPCVETMPSTILTLALNDASQVHFESLRRLHYPAKLNQIPAHITFFHVLPATENIASILGQTAEQTMTFPIEVTGVVSLGRGAAYSLRSDAAQQLHRSLSLAFGQYLTQQDRQGFRPHTVIQNKVTAELASATLNDLKARFAPWHATAIGLDWWDYLQGPWRLRQRFEFR